MQESGLKSDAVHEHYRGDVYGVMMSGTHTETGEQVVVVYTRHDKDNGQVWVRPKKATLFDEFDEVEDDKGKTRHRFEKVVVNHLPPFECSTNNKQD